MPAPSPSRVVFSGPLLRIGEFRCPPDHAAWTHENRAHNHLIVFPRIGVWIAQAGRSAVVADPNTVMFYNAGCTYRRAAISDRGDECEWFSVPSAVIAGAASAFDPGVDDRPEQPFAFDHTPGDSADYLLQRRIYELAKSTRGDPRHALAVEELFMSVLRATLARAYRARGLRPQPASARAAAAQRDAVEATKALLARRFTEPLALSQLADAVELSPCHLCRVFRRHTGLPIYRYRNRLRVRSALEAIRLPDADLTSLALSLGFCSHAHFTGVFRREFGRAPSDVRRDLARRSARQHQ